MEGGIEMKCGTCGHPFSLMAFMEIHWKQTGCQKGNDVWERVMKSKAAGHSGKRILREAYPTQYPSKPMPEELKARWKESQSSEK
jgi:hypothetical protein